jgi:hypothetical protein
MRGRIHNTSFYSKIKNRPNKLEFYITLGWKGLLPDNTIAYLAHLYVMKKMKCSEYGATTLSIMTLSIMTLSIMTLSIMTLSVMTLSIMTLSIMTFSTFNGRNGLNKLLCSFLASFSNLVLCLRVREPS